MVVWGSSEIGGGGQYCSEPVPTNINIFLESSAQARLIDTLVG